ncbi:MAG: hypothetical protein ACC657_01505 [Thiohalomonadales bacterium]
MLTGIRNICIINSVVAILLVLNFYLPITADAWVEVRIALVITAGLFLLTGPILLIRIRFIWHFVRIMCYINALILVLYFISLVGKGYLLSLPVYILLFLLFGFYFIGERGYLNSNTVRDVYGLTVEEK